MRIVGLRPLLLRGACGSSATDPSGATPSEARQFNDAAAMLDANSVSPEALNESGGQ